MPAQVRSPALPATIDTVNQICANTRAGSSVKEDQRCLPLRRDAEGEPDSAELG